MNYETFAAPVAGGLLAGGIWRRAGTAAACHRHTARRCPRSAWSWRSNELPPPYGLVQHADDLVALLDHMGIERALVVGHSMGAFVAVRMAERHPKRVLGPVLIDGGVPLPLPSGVAPEELPALVLGPALERLSRTFASRENYLEFWRKHPAFAAHWSALIEDYVDYNLVGTAPELTASASSAAVAENALELDGSAGYSAALAALATPVDFIRAPRGLLNQPDALYSHSDMAQAEAVYPSLRTHEADDVNHYTIVMSAEGAAQIVPLIAARLGALISVEKG